MFAKLKAIPQRS